MCEPSILKCSYQMCSLGLWGWLSDVAGGSSSMEPMLRYCSARELPSEPVIPCCRLGTLLQSRTGGLPPEEKSIQWAESLSFSRQACLWGLHRPVTGVEWGGGTTT